MYTQFFGNFLLNEKLITPDQLVHAMSCMKNTTVKLGFLAISAGLMTSEQVESVHSRQTREDKRFGDIAIEMGFLTKDQVGMLLDQQTSAYLILGQAIVDNRYMRHFDVERALYAYNKKYSLSLIDIMNNDTKINDTLINSLYDFSKYEHGQYYKDYITLLMNNFIRFIGSDFTPLKPEVYTGSPSYKFVSQNINGKINLSTCIFSNRDALAPFAFRYTEEDLSNYEEYIIAAFQDFLNLHNGLFIVNMSNEHQIELSLTPPIVTSELDTAKEEYLVFPFQFSFGTINFAISI